MLQRGWTDGSRIGVDYLKDGRLLGEVLRDDRLPELVSAFNQRMAEMTREQLADFEAQLVENYLRRSRAGELDIVVTYFYSVAKALVRLPQPRLPDPDSGAVRQKHPSESAAAKPVRRHPGQS